MAVINADAINTYIKKLWLSPLKEEQWLNAKAQDGYTLVDRSLMTYTFNKGQLPKGYKYTVCYLRASPTSDTSAEYIESRENSGSKLVCTFANYAYFLTPVSSTEDIKHDARAKRSHLGNLLFLQGGFFAFFLCMLCYNLIYWLRFSAAGNVVEAQKGFINKISIDLTSLFGNYRTTPFISFYLMLLIIFTPLTVYYIDAYIEARKHEKNVSTNE